MLKYTVDKIYSVEELQQALDYRSNEGAKLEALLNFPLSDKQLENNIRFNVHSNKETIANPIFVMVTSKQEKKTKKGTDASVRGGKESL